MFGDGVIGRDDVEEGRGTWQGSDRDRLPTGKYRKLSIKRHEIFPTAHAPFYNSDIFEKWTTS